MPTLAIEFSKHELESICSVASQRNMTPKDYVKAIFLKNSDQEIDKPDNHDSSEDIFNLLVHLYIDLIANKRDENPVEYVRNRLSNIKEE